MMKMDTFISLPCKINHVRTNPLLELSFPGDSLVLISELVRMSCRGCRSGRRGSGNQDDDLQASNALRAKAVWFSGVSFPLGLDRKTTTPCQETKADLDMHQGTIYQNRNMRTDLWKLECMFCE